MLIVFSVIFFLILVGGFVLAIWAYNKGYENTWYGGIATCVLSGLALLICIGLLIGFHAQIATSHVIDTKIEMYEQENAIIEEKINVAISTYLQHEKDTLTSLNPENAIAILANYPELKSDTLVKDQIDKYIANHSTILSLKEQKINLSVKQWWINFGK